MKRPEFLQKYPRFTEEQLAAIDELLDYHTSWVRMDYPKSDDALYAFTQELQELKAPAGSTESTGEVERLKRALLQCEQSFRLDAETARCIRKVFLPHSPRRMRNPHPDVVTAVSRYLDALACLPSEEAALRPLNG